MNISYNYVIIGKLDNYRNIFAERFLPDLQFWQGWVTDKLISPDVTVQEIVALFERALGQHPHHILIFDYLDYAIGKYESDEMVSKIIEHTYDFIEHT